MKSALTALLILASTSIAHAEISLGVAVPLSGGYADFGRQVQYGVETAVDHLNAAGGVLGDALAVVISDDECEVDKATAIANQMVGRQIAAMIGHFCSTTSIAAAPVYAAESIIQISPASPDPKFTLDRPNAAGGTYRVYGHFDEQARIAGTYLFENFGEMRVAFAHDRTAYGRSLADAARTQFRTLGGREALRVEFTAGEVAYPGLISRLRSERVDILFVGGYDTETAIIAQQILTAGLSTILMGGDTLMSADFGEIAGVAGDGTLLTYPPDLSIEPAAELILRNLTKNDVPVDGYALYGYAAVQVFAQAAEIAGSLDHDAVMGALNNETFATVIGEVSFDGFGNNTRPGYGIFQWRDGDVLPVNGKGN